MKHGLPALVALMLVAPPVAAAPYPLFHSHDEYIFAIGIHILDDVSDGCWPRPNATQDAVELVFRQAGILIPDQRDIVVKDPDDTVTLLSLAEFWATPEDDREKLRWRSPHTLMISAVGFEVGTTACAVAVRWELTRLEGIFDDDTGLTPSSGLVIYDRNLFLLTGPKAGMQDRITASVRELATGLANAILKARQ